MQTLVAVNVPPTKIVAAVTDSAANMVKAIEHLGVARLYCAAHMLQLAIRSCLEQKDVAPLLASARALVGFFNKSPGQSAKLEDEQRRQYDMAKADQDAKDAKDLVEQKGAAAAPADAGDDEHPLRDPIEQPASAIDVSRRFQPLRLKQAVPTR